MKSDFIRGQISEQRKQKGIMNIEKNIPIPGRSTLGKKSKWPWDKIEVGESFVIEGRTIVRASSMAYYASKRFGFKFTCRTIGEDVRVWRVS